MPPIPDRTPNRSRAVARRIGRLGGGIAVTAYGWPTGTLLLEDRERPLDDVVGLRRTTYGFGHGGLMIVTLRTWTSDIAESPPRVPHPRQPWNLGPDASSLHMSYSIRPLASCSQRRPRHLRRAPWGPRKPQPRLVNCAHEDTLHRKVLHVKGNTQAHSRAIAGKAQGATRRPCSPPCDAGADGLRFRRYRTTFLFLPRVVRRIYIVQDKRPHGMDLDNGFALGGGEVMHSFGIRM